MFLFQVVDANLNGHIYAILTSMYKLCYWNHIEKIMSFLNKIHIICFHLCW